MSSNLSVLVCGISAHCRFLSVGKCSKGIGTRQRWHSKYSWWKMASRLPQRYVWNDSVVNAFDIHWWSSLFAMRSR